MRLFESDLLEKKQQPPIPAIQPGLRDGFMYELQDGVMIRRLPAGKRLARAPPLKDGNLMLPFGFGQIVVYDLGRILTDRPTFSTQTAIFPLGFKMAR